MGKDRTRRDETGRDGTRRDEAGRDGAKRDGTRQDETGRDGTSAGVRVLFGMYYICRFFLTNALVHSKGCTLCNFGHLGLKIIGQSHYYVMKVTGPAAAFDRTSLLHL
jgi:hypothetical protein